MPYISRGHQHAVSPDQASVPSMARTYERFTDAVVFLGPVSHAMSAHVVNRFGRAVAVARRASGRPATSARPGSPRRITLTFPVAFTPPTINTPASRRALSTRLMRCPAVFPATRQRIRHDLSRPIGLECAEKISPKRPDYSPVRHQRRSGRQKGTVLPFYEICVAILRASHNSVTIGRVARYEIQPLSDGTALPDRVHPGSRLFGDIVVLCHRATPDGQPAHRKTAIRVAAPDG